MIHLLSPKEIISPKMCLAVPPKSWLYGDPLTYLFKISKKTVVQLCVSSGKLNLLSFILVI